MNYNINQDRLIFDNLPNKLRKLKFFRLVQAIFSQLTISYNSFLSFREQTNFDIKISAVTIVLEKYLQMKFSNTGIQIENASFLFQQSYLYRDQETGNAIVDNYIKTKTEAGTNGNSIYLYRQSEAILNYDFLVKIPVQVIQTGITLDQIKSVIEQYKNLGTIYEIQIIT